MEHRWESKRGSSAIASTNRHVRGGALGPKDVSGQNEVMNGNREPLSWERAKKDRMKSLQISVFRNKRKQQESHLQSRNNEWDDVDEWSQKVENAEDKEPHPPPPVVRRPGRFRGGGKEREAIMDIPLVPRKARSTISSSSRFNVSKRHFLPDGVPQQFPSAHSMPLNGMSSANSLAKSSRRKKVAGTMLPPVKASKVSEHTKMSGQEVEVAEALFVLARSAPSNMSMLESKFEYKAEAKIEATSTAAQPPASSPMYHSGHVSPPLCNGYNQSACLLTAAAPKRKRQRITMRQEEVKVSRPSDVAHHIKSAAALPSRESVQQTLSEVDEERLIQADPSDVNNVTKNHQTLVEAEENSVVKGSSLVSGQAEMVKSEKPELGELRSCSIASSLLNSNIVEKECLADTQSDNRGNNVHGSDNGLLTRERDMAAVANEPCMNADAKQLSVNDYPIMADSHDEMCHVKVEECCEGKTMEQVDNVRKANRSLADVPHPVFQSSIGLTEEDSHLKKAETDNTSASAEMAPASAHSAVGTSVALANWMNGLPAAPFYGSGAPSWPPQAMSSCLDIKTTHPSVQLPPSIILPSVAKMKRCATHVYLAFFINREQQYSRHKFWSTVVLCRGAPYAFNIPSMKPFENEKASVGTCVDLAKKGPSPRPTCTSQSTIGLENPSGTAAGRVVNMTTQAQYIQAMLQQSGYTSPFPFHVPCCQASELFNAPFFPAHLLPVPSQVSSVLPAQKQGLDARPTPSPQHQPQPLQMLSTACSLPMSQKLNFGGHLEKDNVESLSTAESRLCVMQKGGKLLKKADHGQQSVSLMQSIQKVHQNAADVGQVDIPDPSVSESFPEVGLSGVNRGSVGCGLLPVPQVIVRNNSGAIHESLESCGVHTQQWNFGSHSQQCQRTICKASMPAVNDTFFDCNKGHDFIKDRKPFVKQVGAPLNLIDGSLSCSPSLHTTDNTGPVLSLIDATLSRNSGPASSSVSGQVPLLQNQSVEQAYALSKNCPKCLC